MQSPETRTKGTFECERAGARKAETLAVLLDLARRPKARRARMAQAQALAVPRWGQGHGASVHPLSAVLSLLAFLALLGVLARIAA
jgi:hypothetical protein